MKRRVFVGCNAQLVFNLLTGRAAGVESLGVVEMVSTDQNGDLVFTVSGGDALPPDGSHCTVLYRTFDTIGGRATIFDGLKPKA